MEFPEQITTGLLFLRFAYLVTLGLVQILAARHRRHDLSPLAFHPNWAYSVGLALLIAGHLWFFGTHSEEILAPGAASSEFAFFLILALALALLTSVLPARLLLRGRNLPASGEGV